MIGGEQSASLSWSLIGSTHVSVYPPALKGHGSDSGLVDFAKGDMLHQIPL